MSAPGEGFASTPHSADGLEITVSYWESLEAIAAWRAHPEHRVAQERGKREWYSRFELRVARVENARAGPPPR